MFQCLCLEQTALNGKSNTVLEEVTTAMTHVRHVTQPVAENRAIYGSAHESDLTTVNESWQEYGLIKSIYCSSGPAFI